MVGLAEMRARAIHPVTSPVLHLYRVCAILVPLLSLNVSRLGSLSAFGRNSAS